MTDYPVLKAKVALTGTIEAVTGMHIGGPDVGLAVGGADKLIVRDPKDNRPYVPGSSLKGKMRSLLEKSGYARGFMVEMAGGGKPKAAPCKCGHADCRVCLVFGVPAEDSRPGHAPHGVKDRGVH
jgi:CRISPR-associated protein Csm3